MHSRIVYISLIICLFNPSTDFWDTHVRLVFPFRTLCLPSVINFKIEDRIRDVGAGGVREEVFQGNGQK
jgi:hypothetical protein